METEENGVMIEVNGSWHGTLLSLKSHGFEYILPGTDGIEANKVLLFYSIHYSRLGHQRSSQQVLLTWHSFMSVALTDINLHIYMGLGPAKCTYMYPSDYAPI